MFGERKLSLLTPISLKALCVPLPPKNLVGFFFLNRHKANGGLEMRLLLPPCEMRSLGDYRNTAARMIVERSA